MPVYEYHCQNCGKSFEELKRMEDRGSAVCPECGGAAEKSLSPFAAVTGSCCSSGGDVGCSPGSCCSGGSCGCGG
jgi:putative FmdB family regulatory protein